MDDFLYNLRRDSDKRNRRQGSGQQQQQSYRGPDRRNEKDQRRGFPPRRPESAEPQGLPGAILPEIRTLLETISENQKLLLENDSRKTQALEVIASALRSMAGGGVPAEAPTISAAAAPAPAVKEPEPEPSIEEEMVAAPVAEEVVAAVPEDPAPAADDSSPVEETPIRSERGDVRKLALSLRDKGMTFKEIAAYLDEEKIPTFSGKGGWHAPTIHKLCKETAE